MTVGELRQQLVDLQESLQRLAEAAPAESGAASTTSARLISQLQTTQAAARAAPPASSGAASVRAAGQACERARGSFAGA